MSREGEGVLDGRGGGKVESKEEETHLQMPFLSPPHFGPWKAYPFTYIKNYFFNDYFIYISIIYLGRQKYSLYVNKGWEVPGPRPSPITLNWN